MGVSVNLPNASPVVEPTHGAASARNGPRRVAWITATATAPSL